MGNREEAEEQNSGRWEGNRAFQWGAGQVLRRNGAIRKHFRTDCMTLILPSCACTPQVYLSLCNLLLFFPQDGLCLRDGSELCSGGDSTGCRERRHSWEWSCTQSCSSAAKVSLKRSEKTPFKHSPDCPSNENFRLKPVHAFSEYPYWWCKSYGALGFFIE